MSITVSSGWTINITSVRGDLSSVSSSVSGAVVDAGGTLDVNNGGAAYGTLVSGLVEVGSGGIVSGSLLSAGGEQIVSSGGVAMATDISWGSEIVSGGAAIATTLSNYNALQTVLAGGTADATVVNGGTQIVSAGGIADATSVNGGSQIVLAGGTASATTLGPNSEQVVSSGGIAFDTILSGSTFFSAILDIEGGVAVLSGNAAPAQGVVEFGSGGGTLEISGTVMPSVTIDGMVPGHNDSIDLPSVAFDPLGQASLDNSTKVLTFVEGGQTYALSFDPTQDFTGERFLLFNDGNGGTEINIACFAAGTRIATPRGAVPVERLTVGESVLLANGGTAPVIWLGHRRVDCRRHPRPQDVLPVRIAAHAFGLGRPERALWLSPDHAVYVDGVLIPVRYLLNDATVAQAEAAAVARSPIGTSNCRDTMCCWPKVCRPRVILTPATVRPSPTAAPW
jgi:autotransporter passenger strand-loop-strand repeat protein